MFNKVTENYLKCLFECQENQEGYIKPFYLSRIFQVTPAAVSDMLKRLAEDAYIEYQPYKGAKLTEKGKKIGQNMVRRHRIWELYLHQVLKFPWDVVHEEAERLEHASSDQLIDRLDQELGFPNFDPHGEPIPSRSGQFPPPIKSVVLSDCVVGKSYHVHRVEDHDASFLQYLEQIGVFIGVLIEVISRRSFDGAMSIKINTHQEIITSFGTCRIFVQEVKDET